VSGTATGPYPGTFTETGSFGSSFNTPFQASFTIQSPNGTVTGTKTLLLSQGFQCANPIPYAGIDGTVTYSAVIQAENRNYSDSGNGVVHLLYSEAPLYPSSFTETFASTSFASLGPSTLVLSPPTATNTVGEQHCVTATAKDAFGNVTPGVTVFFTVSGANTATGTRTTDASGQAVFCYTGTKAGADTIKAVADADGNGTGEATEPTGTASKVYVPATVATVALTPAGATNTVGQQHCVTATAKDAFGNATPGVKVFFTVSGANTATGTRTTDASGQAVFCYTGTKAGADTITAVADANGNNTADTGEPRGAAAKTYIAATPTTVTVTPAAATNTVGQQHCVTATATDAFGNPTAGYTVYFTVTGTTTVRDRSSGTATTGSNGTAQFCYTAQFPGADTIKAVVDADKNGTAATTEPTGTATKTYVLPVSTALCQVTIDNGGWIIAANADRANFGGNAKVSATREVKGEQVYIDNGPASPLRMKSTTVLAVVCSRTTATIYGSRTLNDSVPVLYRIQVTDGGKGGKTDTYGILLSTGYYSGEQRLQGGNITVRIG
jgi:hypothetical protein